jgi:hypothetical protein
MLISPGLTRVWAPHPLSNLRRIEQPARTNETGAEQRLSFVSQRTHQMHHEFWSNHNALFEQVCLCFFLWTR